MPSPNFRYRFRTPFWVALLLFVASLSGCGQAFEDQHKRVGILMFSDARSPQVEGLMTGLRELGYPDDDRMQYIVRNARQDRSRLRHR